MVSYDVNAYPGSEAPPTPPMDMCQIGYINPAGSGEAGGRPPGLDDPQRHRETYRGIQETCDVPGRHEHQGDNGCGGTCGRDYVPLTLPAAEQCTDQRTYAAGQHYQTFEQQGLREQIRSCDHLGCEDEDRPLGHAQDDPDPEGECGDGGDAPYTPSPASDRIPRSSRPRSPQTHGRCTGYVRIPCGTRRTRDRSWHRTGNASRSGGIGRNGPPLPASHSSTGFLHTSTGHWDILTTFSATLPRSILFIPVFPRVPQTTRS